MFALMNSWEKSSGDSLTTELIRYVGLTYTLTVNDGATMLYLASKRDCDRRALKSRAAPSRLTGAALNEGARDMARQVARSWEVAPRAGSAKRSR